VRDHLDPDLPIRNTIRGGFSVLMGFEFKAVLPFIPFFIQQMEDNFSVLYRLAVGISHNGKIQGGGGGLIWLRKYGQRKKHYENPGLSEVNHRAIVASTLAIG
jgi:hypothetical protein